MQIETFLEHINIKDVNVAIMLMFIFGFYTLWTPVSTLPFHQLLKHAIPLAHLQPTFFKTLNIVEMCTRSPAITQTIATTLKDIAVSNDINTVDETMSDFGKLTLNDIITHAFPVPQTTSVGTRCILELLRDFMFSIEALSLPIP